MKLDININQEKNKKGKIVKVYIRFGPHYFVEIEDKEKVIFKLGATHHGFKADASVVAGELEEIIYKIREQHPKNIID